MVQLASHGKSPETSFYWARSVLIRAGDIRTGGSLGPVESAIVSFIKTCQASLLEMVYFPVEPRIACPYSMNCSRRTKTLPATREQTRRPNAQLSLVIRP